MDHSWRVLATGGFLGETLGTPRTILNLLVLRDEQWNEPTGALH